MFLLSIYEATLVTPFIILLLSFLFSILKFLPSTLSPYLPPPPMSYTRLLHFLLVFVSSMGSLFPFVPFFLYTESVFTCRSPRLPLLVPYKLLVILPIHITHLHPGVLFSRSTVTHPSIHFTHVYYTLFSDHFPPCTLFLLAHWYPSFPSTSPTYTPSFPTTTHPTV